MASSAFNFHEMIVFGENIKFYYIDQDGDIISISGQGDLDEARQVLNGQLRLVCAKSNEEARQVLGESAINRSEILNQSVNLGQPTSNNSGPGQFKEFGNIFEQMMQAGSRFSQP